MAITKEKLPQANTQDSPKRITNSPRPSGVAGIPISTRPSGVSGVSATSSHPSGVSGDTVTALRPSGVAEISAPSRQTMGIFQQTSRRGSSVDPWNFDSSEDEMGYGRIVRVISAVQK